MNDALTAMRILFVIDGLAGGGAEKNFLTVARESALRGHRVDIVTLRDERAWPLPEGVSCIPCYDTAPRRLRKIGEIRRRGRILDRTLAELSAPDLALTTLVATDRIVRMSQLADPAWYRIPISLSREMLAPVGGLRRLRRRARLKRTYDDRKVVAVSAGVARDLVERVGARPSRIEVIHNPFSVDEIRSRSEEPCDLAGRDYVACVARLNPQKRHDRLLGALSRSRFRGRLVLVGDGPVEARRALARRAEELGLADRVDLLGFQPNPYPIIRHARALVLASDFEGFPNVLVESLICGTPAVSTRCPHGPDEILTGDLSTGLADLTEKGLAEAIDRVLETPPEIQPEHYELFAADKITDRYVSLADRGSRT